jgi:hypothetical protein
LQSRQRHLGKSCTTKDKEKAGKKSISKCKKATVVKEEDKVSMYLQQQQTSSKATQPQLALADDALY